MTAEKTFPVKKFLRFTEDLEKRIIDYRFSHRLSSEAEAMRQLIELGLAAAAQKRKEKA